MKKIVSLFLTFALCLALITPQTAYAAVKISKAKATMEVDSTLKLKIFDTEEDIIWSSNKKLVAKVSSTGTITAKSEGQATITATVKNKKYTCKVTVVDSNAPDVTPTPTPKPSPTPKPTPIEKNTKDDNKSITVYITKTGTKYHRSGCRYLSKSKIAIKLENAKAAYSPCSVCRP